MGQAPVEVVQFVDPARDLVTLTGENSFQLVRDLVAEASGAKRRKVGCLGQREVELTKANQQSQPRHVGLGVITVPVGVALGGRQQARPFVEPDRVTGCTEALGEISDAHAARLDPRAARMSSVRRDNTGWSVGVTSPEGDARVVGWFDVADTPMRNARMIELDLDVAETIRRNGGKQPAARLWVVREDDELVRDALRD